MSIDLQLKRPFSPLIFLEKHTTLLDVVIGILWNITAQPVIHPLTSLPLLHWLTSFSCVYVVADEGQRQLSMSILYNISMDHKFRSMFADTNCIPQVRLANVHCQQSKTHTLASATNDIQELMHEKQSESERHATSGTKTHQRIAAHSSVKLCAHCFVSSFISFSSESWKQPGTISHFSVAFSILAFLSSITKRGHKHRNTAADEN